VTVSEEVDDYDLMVHICKVCGKKCECTNDALCEFLLCVDGKFICKSCFNKQEAD